MTNSKLPELIFLQPEKAGRFPEIWSMMKRRHTVLGYNASSFIPRSAEFAFKSNPAGAKDDSIQHEFNELKDQIKYLEQNILEIRNHLKALEDVIPNFMTSEIDSIANKKCLNDEISLKSPPISINIFTSNDDEEKYDCCGNQDNNDEFNVSDSNSQNFQILPQMDKNLHDSQEISYHDVDLKNKLDIYHTGGVYLHTILMLCYNKSGTKKSWLAAVGVLLLTILHILSLEMIFHDSIIRLESKEEEEICGVITYRQIIVFIFMSVLFACIIHRDVNESEVEEIVLNHAVSRYKDNISSLRAVEIIHLCLRFRRYLLPWRLAQTAIYLTLQEDILTTNEIVLNFLSVGFIAEADNLIGRFLFGKSDDHEVETIVAGIDIHHNDGNHLNLPIVYFFRSQALAILPTMVLTGSAIAMIKKETCINNLLMFYRVFSTAIPGIIIAVHSITDYILDKQSCSVFERYVRSMRELILNLAAFSLYLVVVMSDDSVTYDGNIISIAFGMACTCFLVFSWCGNYYWYGVSHFEKTRKNIMFALICSIAVIASYSGGIILSILEYNRIKL